MKEKKSENGGKGVVVLMKEEQVVKNEKLGALV